MTTCTPIYNFQLLYLALINDGRYYDDIRYLWYSILYLGSCIISKVWLTTVYQHTGKIAELLVYKLHTYKSQEQFSRQLQHYQSYRKFTESYRLFKHDYKHMMSSLKILLYNQEYEQVNRLLDNIHDTMQRDVLVHKTYSDHMLLDAILQDAANTCSEKSQLFFCSFNTWLCISTCSLCSSCAFFHLRTLHVHAHVRDTWVRTSSHLTVSLNSQCILLTSFDLILNHHLIDFEYILVSFLHSFPLYLHNILYTKNVCYLIYTLNLHSLQISLAYFYI